MYSEQPEKSVRANLNISQVGRVPVQRPSQNDFFRHIDGIVGVKSRSCVPSSFVITKPKWVCLKIGYIPNEIAI